MCVITATELKEHLNKYMELSETEDVYVKKNGKIKTVLRNPKKGAWERFFALAGSVPYTPGKSDEEILYEAINEHETSR